MANTNPSDLADDIVFVEEEEEEANDFSYWEFINESDADSDTESVQSIENGFVSWFTFPPPPRSHSDLQIQTLEPPDTVDSANFIDDDDDEEGKGDDMHDDDDGDSEDDDGYGLDDELVPWNMAGKFGRERMRKLGKRYCSKMVNSKRNPYAYVKPGCVHGKHGLGMKA